MLFDSVLAKQIIEEINVSFQLKILSLVLLFFSFFFLKLDQTVCSKVYRKCENWSETHFNYKMNSLLIHDYVFIKISKWNAKVRGSSMTHLMQEEGKLSFERISIFHFMNSTNSKWQWHEINICIVKVQSIDFKDLVNFLIVFNYN